MPRAARRETPPRSPDRTPGRASSADRPSGLGARPRRQYGERLRDRPVEVRGTKLLEEDRVRAPQRLEAFAVDRPEYAHRETRAGKRMPPEDVLRDAELGSHAPDLVLEEAAERLDDFERHHLWKNTDVVMRLDASARLRIPRARLDHVGVDRPLHEERLRRAVAGEAFHPRDAFEAANELLSDDRALPFRI